MPWSSDFHPDSTKGEKTKEIGRVEKVTLPSARRAYQGPVNIKFICELPADYVNI